MRRAQDFVSAVMDVDYSPTGREFVAGSYDRTVRIFPFNGGHSREVYFTKRMQRVFAVKFSGDGSYVFSGSDDMNVRVWKAEAAAQQGVVLPREKHKQAYQKALVERYKHLPEIKKVVRHRNVPKAIHKVRRRWLRRVATACAVHARRCCAASVRQPAFRGPALEILRSHASAARQPGAGPQTPDLPTLAPIRPAQAAKMRRAVQESVRRKLSNRIKHSAPGSVKVKPERKKKIVAEVE